MIKDRFVLNNLVTKDRVVSALAIWVLSQSIGFQGTGLNGASSAAWAQFQTYGDNTGGSSYQNLPPLQPNTQGTPQTNYGYNSGYTQGSNQGYTQSSGGGQPLQGYVSTAPVGTFMQARLSTTLSSEYARSGDRFTAILGSPVSGSGGIILPSGSQLEGVIASVQPAGRAGRPGTMEVRFTGATLPNGQRVALSAHLQTKDGTGLIKGGSGKERLGKAALRTGIGAGLGAALGTAMGPLSGGRVGRGAIYGTALGGGLGAASALADKGDEAVLSSNDPLNIVLDQPLTLQGGGGQGIQNSGYDSNYGNYNNNNSGGYNSNYGSSYGNSNYNYGGGGY